MYISSSMSPSLSIYLTLHLHFLPSSSRGAEEDTCCLPCSPHCWSHGERKQLSIVSRCDSCGWVCTTLSKSWYVEQFPLVVRCILVLLAPCNWIPFLWGHRDSFVAHLTSSWWQQWILTITNYFKWSEAVLTIEKSASSVATALFHAYG